MSVAAVPAVPAATISPPRASSGALGAVFGRISDLAWAGVAGFIGRHPALVDRLLARSLKTPYYDLRGKDGTVYMGRNWLMPRFLLEPDAKGRLKPKSWVPIAIRIHHICRRDLERDQHDHPWSYRTVILRGFYVEEGPDNILRLYSAGTTKAQHATHFHRIDSVSEGGVYTLFIVRKKTHEWGFNVDGVKVPWTEYLDENETVRDIYANRDLRREVAQLGQGDAHAPAAAPPEGGKVVQLAERRAQRAEYERDRFVRKVK